MAQKSTVNICYFQIKASEESRAVHPKEDEIWLYTGQMHLHLGKTERNVPGGKIEPNETVFQAAARETLEEVYVTLSHSLDYSWSDSLALFLSSLHISASPRFFLSSSSYSSSPSSSLSLSSEYSTHTRLGLILDPVNGCDAFLLEQLVAKECGNPGSVSCGLVVGNEITCQLDWVPLSSVPNLTGNLPDITDPMFRFSYHPTDFVWYQNEWIFARNLPTKIK